MWTLITQLTTKKSNNAFVAFVQTFFVSSSRGRILAVSTHYVSSALLSIILLRRSIHLAIVALLHAVKRHGFCLIRQVVL